MKVYQIWNWLPLRVYIMLEGINKQRFKKVIMFVACSLVSNTVIHTWQRIINLCLSIFIQHFSFFFAFKMVWFADIRGFSLNTSLFLLYVLTLDHPTFSFTKFSESFQFKNTPERSFIEEQEMWKWLEIKMLHSFGEEIYRQLEKELIFGVKQR